jgi:hypothetical protein
MIRSHPFVLVLFAAIFLWSSILAMAAGDAAAGKTVFTRCVGTWCRAQERSFPVSKQQVITPTSSPT